MTREIEIDLPPGMTEEMVRKVFQSYAERKAGVRGGSGYRVLVREPGESQGHAIELIRHIWEGRDFISEVAPTYPEGTLLYITSGTGRGHGGLKETYVVDEWGEAIKRGYGRGWIPHGGSPVEGVDIGRFKTVRGALNALRYGYVKEGDLEEEGDEP